jgi:hypothetical protein
MPVSAGVTVSLPDADFIPLHAPLAVQLAPLVFHVRAALSPTVMVVGCIESEMLAGGLEPPSPP